MTLIKCENLSVGYENKRIFSDLNFSIKHGDYLCVVGENGSGKSTLIKTLLSLKETLVGNIDFSSEFNKNEIGYLPQQTDIQKNFPASVWEIVISGCINKRGFVPFYTKEDKERAKQNIVKLGLTDLKDRAYNELSGGQQQRVLLARALGATSKLLILDEPVSGLDPSITQEMYQLINDINSDGITIIMVSHDIRGIVKYATHILHLNGDNSFFGDVEAYRNTNLFKSFTCE